MTYSKESVLEQHLRVRREGRATASPQPALLASLPEPVPVSAHPGDGQAQGASARRLSSHIDRATGFLVEHLLYSKKTADILGRSSFWFAYPHEGANVFDGASGDTKAAAIKKLQAKRAPQRRAA